MRTDFLRVDSAGRGDKLDAGGTAALNKGPHLFESFGARSVDRRDCWRRKNCRRRCGARRPRPRSQFLEAQRGLVWLRCGAGLRRQEYEQRENEQYEGRAGPHPFRGDALLVHARGAYTD